MTCFLAKADFRAARSASVDGAGLFPFVKDISNSRHHWSITCSHQKEESPENRPHDSYESELMTNKPLNATNKV